MSNVRQQKQGDKTSDGVKPIPYLNNCSTDLQAIAVKILLQK